MLDIPDPYLSLADGIKRLDPSADIHLRRFKREDVQAVDKLVELSKGKREVVTTEEDWRLVEIIMQFYMQRWPQEFQDFYNAIPQIREAKGKGYSKTKEIQHVGSLPYKFMKLVQAIFPYQQFDKKFVHKLVRRIPLLKVGGA